jgi:signal transduction histidine kinase
MRNKYQFKISPIYSLLFIVFFLVACTPSELKLPYATDGIISLHEPIQEEKSLDGEWHFYWDQLYTPIEIQEGPPTAPHIVKVPGDWNTYQLSQEKISRHGYGTFHLRFHIVPEDIGNIHALYIPNIASSYQLWINGEHLATSGSVGKNRTETKPYTVPSVINFYADTEIIDVIIQVSNFQQRKSGIYDSIILGDPKTISTNHETSIIYRAIIVVTLLAVGLYYLSLFSIRRKDWLLFYFGMTCIAIATRAIAIEEGLAQYLFPFFSWELIVKFEYLGASVGTLFFTLFAYAQFKSVMNKQLRNLIVVTMATYSLFVIVTPAYIFTLTMTIFQLAIFLGFLYFLYVYLAAFIRKSKEMKLSLIAMILFWLTIINDILYFNHIIQTIELTSVGMLLFLISQSYNLCREHARSFNQIEDLSDRLNKLNHSLEQQVEDRTSQLQSSNLKLFQSNKELHEVHKSQKRLLSNVSHELGTPLTTMKGYIQGMTEGIIPLNHKYMKIINQKVNYLTQIFNDLESLLKINSSEMSFQYKPVDARLFCHSLFKNYQNDFNKNDVTFSYEDHLPNDELVTIVIDPYRIEQVFVNLLTNAYKALEGAGKITIYISLNKHNELLIQFIDTGIGVDEKEASQLFERFYRGKVNKTNRDGAGLGLSISKEIIIRHNGTIGIHPNVGQGSTFFITLPLEET